MSWYFGTVSLPVGFDAQQNPVPAIFLFALVSLALWFLVAQARRRDARSVDPGSAADRAGAFNRGGTFN